MRKIQIKVVQKLESRLNEIKASERRCYFMNGMSMHILTLSGALLHKIEHLTEFEIKFDRLHNLL